MSIESFWGFITAMFNTEPQDVIEPTPIEDIIVEDPDDDINTIIVERKLRPTSFKEYQTDSNMQSITIIEEAIKACELKNMALPHILIFGPAGTGKTTLSYIIANECKGCKLIETIGSAIKNQQDIMTILLKVLENQQQGFKTILFIDEIHKLSKNGPATTQWYTILEDSVFFHSLKDKVINGYTIEDDRLDLDKFTVIGATTDPADLTEPMRDRFGIHCVLNPYSLRDIIKVLKTTAKHRKYNVTSVALRLLASRSRGTPRLSINFLEASERKRTVTKKKKIDKDIVEQLFKDLHIDGIGLTDNDIKILDILNSCPKGIGAKSLAGRVHIDEKSLVDMYLSYLDRIGLTVVTHKRFITEEGKKYIDRKTI